MYKHTSTHTFVLTYIYYIYIHAYGYTNACFYIHLCFFVDKTLPSYHIRDTPKVSLNQLSHPGRSGLLDYHAHWTNRNAYSATDNVKLDLPSRLILV